MDLKKAVSGILAATIVAGTATSSLPSVSAATEKQLFPQFPLTPPSGTRRWKAGAPLWPGSPTSSAAGQRTTTAMAGLTGKTSQN